MTQAECPVCYERNASKKLICGHEFCAACVKRWYTEGTSPTCPMCRRRIHYRRMPVKKWAQEEYEKKKARVFEESFEELLSEIMEPLVIDDFDDTRFPIFSNDTFDPEIEEVTGALILHRRNVSTSELRDLEVTFDAIKHDATPDEIDYVLNETGDYYSNRHTHLRNRVYPEGDALKKTLCKRNRNDRRAPRIRVGYHRRR